MRRVASLSGMGQRGLCLDRATRNSVSNKSVPFFPAPTGGLSERSGGFATVVGGGGISKRVISVTVAGEEAGGRVFRGVRYYKKE